MNSAVPMAPSKTTAVFLQLSRNKVEGDFMTKDATGALTIPVFPYSFSFYRQIVVRKKKILQAGITILPAQQDNLVVYYLTKDILTVKIHHCGFLNKYFSMTKPSQKSLLNGTFLGIKEAHLLRKITCYSLFKSSPKVNL